MTTTEIEEQIAKLQKELSMLKMEQDDEIFLLSIDEYNKYREYIPAISILWFLRSPGNISLNAASVDYDGSVNDDGLDVYFDYAIRPALKYANIKSKIAKSNKGDNYFVFNECRWKIIDREREIAITEMPIGFEKFDDNSNDYENSYIRTWLLDWIKGAKS